ncbi:MAG: DUF6462 family protein, partial [Oscillospiraceae bacterium]|nr:DUF6462 family protein [Oscillospiraceae bacterium]
MARTKRKLDFDTIDKLVGSGKKKFVRYEEGAALYSMGRQTFMR